MEKLKCVSIDKYAKILYNIEKVNKWGVDKIMLMPHREEKRIDRIIIPTSIYKNKHFKRTSMCD